MNQQRIFIYQNIYWNHLIFYSCVLIFFHVLAYINIKYHFIINASISFQIIKYISQKYFILFGIRWNACKTSISLLHHVLAGPKVKISFVQARLVFVLFDPGIILLCIWIYHNIEMCFWLKIPWGLYSNLKGLPYTKIYKIDLALRNQNLNSGSCIFWRGNGNISSKQFYSFFHNRKAKL